MGLISLYRKYAFVDYQNHLCSCASFVTLLVILVSIFIPFALIFKVNNWKFSSTDDLVIYEQPFVSNLAIFKVLDLDLNYLLNSGKIPIQIHDDC